MATREARVQRGRRRGDELIRRLASEIRVARQTAGLSQQAVAAQLGWSQTEVSRLERFRYQSISVPRLCEIGSVLGLDFAAGFSPFGDPLRDSGQQAAVRRFVILIASPPYAVLHEVLLPHPGDRRSWDLLLRLDSQLTGVEVEARVRDLQQCVRRIRERERDGGVHEVLVVLADTVHNRALVRALRDALGPRYATSPRLILAALRGGKRMPGSGVILV